MASGMWALKRAMWVPVGHVCASGLVTRNECESQREHPVDPGRKDSCGQPQHRHHHRSADQRTERQLQHWLPPEEHPGVDGPNDQVARDLLPQAPVGHESRPNREDCRTFKHSDLDDSVINDVLNYNEIGMKAYMKGSDEKNNISEIEYSEELGLSIVKPPNKLKVSDLWKVL
eukprot:CAMPEP_0116937560 /NCGR_PEP_ID=MMETSP0467-20121206/31578_1 /TAXON_ID=283647 /ORGANISM="Mesodinium pulex, Strain SPMC105" /LENGTH=172 /DNA_ID=CAMNT_0004619401 /DNA_START=538 /DNA_END=1058 /DNA_ORIENTATION=+